jgi:ribonuclease HI
MKKPFAVYTDASFKDEMAGYSFLYYEIFGEEPIYIYYGKEYALSSSTAELIAIRRAIEYIVEKHVQISAIEIRCDNLEIINDFKIYKSSIWKGEPIKKVNNPQAANYFKEWLYFCNLIIERTNIKLTIKKIKRNRSRYHRLVDEASKVVRKDENYKSMKLYCGNIINGRKLDRTYDKAINFDILIS